MLVRLRLRPHCMPIYEARPCARCKMRLFIKPFVVFNPRLNSIFYEANQHGGSVRDPVNNWRRLSPGSSEFHPR